MLTGSNRIQRGFTASFDFSQAVFKLEVADYQ